MSGAQQWESKVLQNLRQASAARGFEFHINPPREIVPTFLGDFQPAAIALGPEGGIIIEIKHRRSTASDRQLAAIAKKVAGQKGWEFRAVYLNPPINQTPPIPKPTVEQLEAKFVEIDSLKKGGHIAAALVAAWSALESLARLARADNETTFLNALSPVQAIQTLAEQGYIENEVADALRSMAQLRNAVIHGDLAVDVPADQVDALLKQLRNITSEIVNVISNQNA